MPSPGIITEQGFAAGEGLGFNPLSEQDAQKVQSEKDDFVAGHNDSTDKESGR